jgi:phosphohistidine phosphatase
VTPRFLTLLRHGKSSWELGESRDHERPLEARGQRAAAVVGAWMAQRHLAPDLVLCSTAERTRETLDLILAALPARPEVRFERALYDAAADEIGARLRRLGGGWHDVLVVGHNPGLQQLAALLARQCDPGRASRIEAKFPTCALARFELSLSRWRDLDAKAVRSVELVAPKQLV